MMRKAVGVLLILLALFACAPEQPSFRAVAGTLPPLAAGQARIFFYRWTEPYETTSMSTIYLNDAPVAVSQVGAALYRDVSPGQYFVSVFSRGTYPDQFKTMTIAAGQLLYVRIESLSSYKSSCGARATCKVDTFVVSIVDPSVGNKEMQRLSFIQG